jgi:hypothetical protein
MRHLITALLLSAAAVPALAVEVRVSTSLQNMRIDVADLDPNDGIEAGYSFSPNSGPTVHYSFEEHSVYTTSSVPITGFSDTTKTMRTLADGHSSAFLGTTPTTMLSVLLLDSNDPNFDASATVFIGGNLLVSPHTSISLSAYGLWSSPTAPYTLHTEFGLSLAMGNKFDPDGYSMTSDRGTIPVSATLTNDTDKVKVMTYQFTVSAGASPALFAAMAPEYLPAVPEPATATMALAGLAGLLGWSRRRRPGRTA